MSPISYQDSKPRKRPSHTEENLQQALCEFYRCVVIPGDSMLFAVPNGEQRDKITAAKLVGIKASQRRLLEEHLRTLPFGLGVVPGVTDLVLVLHNGKAPWPVVFVEVKVPEVRDFGGRIIQAEGKLSAEQEDVHRLLGTLDHHRVVVETIDEFEQLLRDCGLRLRTPQAPPRPHVRQGALAFTPPARKRRKRASDAL